MQLLRIHILPVIGILLTLISCNESRQKLEPYPNETGNNKTPFLSIVSPDSGQDNIYKASFELGLNGTSFIQYGQIYQEKNIFYGRLKEAGTEDFKLFDLNSEVGNKDTIRISYKSDEDELSQQKYRIIHEDIITDYNGLDVHIFRIENYYSHLGYKDFDVVVFVTELHGVIGSYIAAEYKEELFYISPAGDILESGIDYSKMEERELQ